VIVGYATVWRFFECEAITFKKSFATILNCPLSPRPYPTRMRLKCKLTIDLKTSKALTRTQLNYLTSAAIHDYSPCKRPSRSRDSARQGDCHHCRLEQSAAIARALAVRICFLRRWR
jgi:hypothetical protein